VRFFREDLHALTGAYALDALESAERDRFTRHLRRCQACANEVRGLRETATRLARAVALVPPPQLRERVLAAVAWTRQLPPETQHVPAPRISPARWFRWRQPGRSGASRLAWFPRPAPLLAAAALAVVVVLGVTLAVTQRELNHSRAQNQAVEAVLSAPDARLLTHAIVAGGRAIVVLSQARHALVLTTSGLPPLPAAKVYELWFIGPGRSTPAGLLPSPTAGRTAPLLAAGLTAGDRIGLTVEPAGGTNKPTTPPILVMSLPA
jgi:anti-sigma-K factor RskA